MQVPHLGPCVQTVSSHTRWTADEEEEASRPNRPVRSGRTLKPESDDDSGVEETFERARGEAQVTSRSPRAYPSPYLTLQHRQRRGYGRQATKADSARGFERNKQKLAESLTSANKVRVRAAYAARD